MDLLLFIILSITLIIVPGPNVLVIVATSVSHGKARGLQTVAGTATAMLIQLLVAALGTSWFVGSLTDGFQMLKWCGVGYLFYLGVTRLFRESTHSNGDLSAAGSFQQGFWVSLTNPKTILFFGAFIPQFVSDSTLYTQQIFVLSSLFWCLALVLDSAYSLLAAKLGTSLRRVQQKKLGFRIGGLTYLGASAALATTQRG